MNGIDIGVVALVGFAGLICFSIGIVRVVLGLLGWVGAILVTLYGYPYARPIARGWIETLLIADAAAILAIFVIALVLLTALSHIVSRLVNESGFRVLDRSLGLLAGLIIGSAVVCVSYLAAVSLTGMSDDRNRRPEWIREARTAPLIEMGADFLLAIAPPQWRPARNGLGERGEDLRESLEIERTVRRLLTPEPKAAPARDESGYTPQERGELDRLIGSQK